MSRTDAWRRACAAGSVTSIRVGSSDLLGSVFILENVALKNLSYTSSVFFFRFDSIKTSTASKYAIATDLRSIIMYIDKTSATIVNIDKRTDIKSPTLIVVEIDPIAIPPDPANVDTIASQNMTLIIFLA
ncbi:MAG: hypothetical protein NTU80_08075 [Verrucomicrobia bacterium]|nr:hypothetical protein [Verrucomicrobiota bacterium]